MLLLLLLLVAAAAACCCLLLLAAACYNKPSPKVIIMYMYMYMCMYMYMYMYMSSICIYIYIYMNMYIYNKNTSSCSLLLSALFNAGMLWFSYGGRALSLNAWSADSIQRRTSNAEANPIDNVYIHKSYKNARKSQKKNQMIPARGPQTKKILNS